MSKIVFFLVALLAACLGVTAVAAPAGGDGPSSVVEQPEADYSPNVLPRLFGGGEIRHYSPDHGFDDRFAIRCDYGNAKTNHWLYEGESSRKYCPADTDQVYVAKGTEIHCFVYWTPVGWKSKLAFDLTGWHKINDLWYDGKGCVHQRD